MPTSLIIGGSSGIGLATAIRLAARHDVVHIAGRTAKSLAAATTSHPSLIPHELDAGDVGQVAVVRPILVDHPGRGEEVAGEPLIPREHL